MILAVEWDRKPQGLKMDLGLLFAANPRTGKFIGTKLIEFFEIFTLIIMNILMSKVNLIR